MATTAGSVFLIDNIAKKDSKVVSNLKAQGAILIAKANLKELANYIGNIPDGYSSYGGRVICGYGKDCIVGGSSSGSAVAETIGLSVFTLGTDTSYSVIHCAGLNGVIGFKPNVKNISQDGVVPITKYLDAVGIFTRNIDDLSIVLNSILKKKNSIKTINKDIYNIGIDNCRKEEIPSEYLDKLNLFIKKIKDNNTNINIENTFFPNQAYIYELMKRDYAISFNNYLSKSTSSIKSFEDLLNAYLNNQEASKYGVDILVKANDFSKQEDNVDRIKEILNTIKHDKKKFMKLLNKYDVIIETGLTSSIHVFNVPSISIPFTKGDNNVPINIIMYSKDESLLLSFSKYISKLIDKELIYKILDEYK